MQQGSLTFPVTLFLTFLRLAYRFVPIVETSFYEIAVFFPTFHLEYPSVVCRFCIVQNESRGQSYSSSDSTTDNRDEYNRDKD